MALARVGVHTGTNTTFASTVATASWTSTSGNILIGIAEADTVGLNGITFTDNKGNSWSRVRSDTAVSTFDLEMWVSYNITGGAGHIVTATDTGGGVDSLIIVEEWSGAATASALDKTTGTTGLASTALNSTATAATAQNDELIIGGGAASGNVTMTAGAGYTNLTKVNTTFSTLAFESQVVATTGAQTATMTSGTAGTWACQVGTFKQAAAATTTTSGNMSMMGVG